MSTVGSQSRFARQMQRDASEADKWSAEERWVPRNQPKMLNRFAGARKTDCDRGNIV